MNAVPFHVTERGAAYIARYQRAMTLIDELHVARQNLLEIPANVREQLRIDAQRLADAVAELNRLGLR